MQQYTHPQAAARFALRDILAPSSTIYLTTLHPTRSGSGRWLKVLTIHRAAIIDISGLVALSLDLTRRSDGTFFVSNEEMASFGGSLAKPLQFALYPVPSERRGCSFIQKEI